MIGVFQYTQEGDSSVAVLDTQQDVTFVHNSSAIVDAFEVILPQNPSDGQTLTLTSVKGVTSLTMTSDIEILSSKTALLSWRYGVWAYSAFLNKWLRIG